MNFRTLLFSEIPLVILGLGILILLGLLLEQTLLFLTFGLAIYLSWNLFHIYRLLNWLFSGAITQLPQAVGTWGLIFSSLDKLQRRNRKRKNRLFDILGRYRDSTEAMPDATIILKSSGEIEWYNEVAREYFGFKAKKDRGRLMTEIVKGHSFLSFLKVESQYDTLEIPSPIDKSRVLSVRIVPYGKGQRLILARDTSKMHQLRIVRKDFVANVSHELRTPITVISGFLESFADYFADNEQLLKSIKIMQQQSDRMSCIVQDLLHLSSLEAADENVCVDEEVAVPSMLECLAKEAEIISGKEKHKISTKIDQSIWIKGNSKELQSAFSNLISNAIRYTPKRGSIKIQWFQNKQGNPILKIEDSGDGIPLEHITRLTERFYRVDAGRSRDSGGTGLGLAIVKHVLNHHGAELLIDSELGKGSVFSCCFPKNLVCQESSRTNP